MIDPSEGFDAKQPVTIRLDCNSGEVSVHQPGKVLGRSNVPLKLIRETGVYFVVSLSSPSESVRIVDPES
jgi:hypothetical protein